ncbi:MAG: S49 family peptidase [Phycisphaerales bacterium]|nr:S49 family peptidase [Planctomycetota bacterium]
MIGNRHAVRSGRALAIVLSLALTSGAIAAELAAQRIGTIEIKGKPAARPGPMSFLGGKQGQTLRELVDAIDAAPGRDDVGALLIRLKDATLTRAQTEELGAAIRRVRSAGKRVTVFSESYDTTDMLLGCYADEIIIQKGGPVSVPGLHMEEMFLADTLAWAGIKADMVQIGDYKGANEQMTRAAPSKPWSENIDQLLDSLYDNEKATLKAGRKLSEDQYQAAMKIVWMADSADAVKSGMVDAELDLPDVTKYVAEKSKLDSSKTLSLVSQRDELDLAASSNPFALFSSILKPAKRTITQESIGVLHIDGTIVDGESKAGFTGEKSVGSRTIRNAIEDMLDEDLVKGVIVRIDSPGGSAVASEVIWQGLKRLAAKKPVWISVGDMAASGGYYIASAGQKIYVNPSSIVGSIGVVGGKMSLAGVYEHLKVHVSSRSRGPMAGMFDSASPWTPEQLTLIRGKMTETFDLFKSRVAEGRHGIDLSKTAGGWVFAGQKVIDLKMADKVGGLRDSLEDMSSQLHLEKYDVVDYPPPPSFAELLEDTIGGVSAPGISAAMGGIGPELSKLGTIVFGDRAWDQISRAAQGLMLLRTEPVLLMHPEVLILR